MVQHDVLAADRLQDYIDGHLSERDQAAVAAYLLARPGIAAEVEALRRQSEILRGIAQAMLDEPVPERLREMLRKRAPVTAHRLSRRAPRYLQAAAAAIALLVTGGALGWGASGGLAQRASAEDELFADMAHAYAFYGEGNYPVDFAPEHAAEFTSWIDRSFERQVQPPDLRDFGYTYRGGRLIPAAGTRLGLFQYEHPVDAGLTVFFWTNAAPPRPPDPPQAGESVAVRFWSGDGLNLAVVSEGSNRDLETAADAVFSFYERSSGTG
jgi:anti-sigma factor RsiW